MCIAWALALLALAGCSTPADSPAHASLAEPISLTVCSQPRPEVCTMEYSPVCSSLAAGGIREHASGCHACADGAVVGYRNGPCSQ